MTKLSVIVFVTCDAQMETAVLREEARKADIDLEIAATDTNDLKILTERRHDFIILGALDARAEMFFTPLESGWPKPHCVYVKSIQNVLRRIRKISSTPVLVNNLPVPNVSPLGLADRGAHSHINRVRQANLALAEAAERFKDVFIVDIDGAFSRFGKKKLLDDVLLSFVHLGSLRGIQQRPSSEKKELHGIIPPMEQLDAFGAIDTFEFERILAREHLSLMISIAGIGRKKCVLVDLDNTLWPGVLAETLSPFGWDPEISGMFSYAGIYFGLHEALQSLADRGIILAVVSKNDEAVIKKYWKYPPQYPPLLTLDDFAAYRINWKDKADNIQEIASELNIGLESMILIDDNPVERENIHQRLPEVTILGGNPFLWRYELLTHPALQAPRITSESRNRTKSMKAQVQREKVRAKAVDAKEFIASLNIQCEIIRHKAGDDLERIHELVLRTNQFNTTTKRYQKHELERLARGRDSGIYGMKVKDRFSDYGVVAVCIVEGAAITSFLMSCRVIGLGVEDVLLRAVLGKIGKKYSKAIGHFIKTDKNLPARHLFANNGFKQGPDDLWELDLKSAIGVKNKTSGYRIKVRGF